MKKETSINILKLLNEYYDQYPTGVLSTSKIAEILKISIKEAQGGCIYLKDKDFIKSFQNFDNQWTQKISVHGIDEIEKIPSQSNEEVPSSHILDLDIENDNFEGIMKVFISHKFVKDDQKLALRFQELLREKQIKGYMAERKRNYELLISDKIKNEIEDSDFVVGVITKVAQTSASVNQELGYAMGKDKPVILLLEKGIEHGVLTYGKETEEFSKENFEKPCNNIVEYLLENNPDNSKIKIGHEEKMRLIDNVYRPCYNQMIKVYDNRKFITSTPDNKWAEIEPFWKLKVEPEMKDLFEKYSQARENFSNTWVQFTNNVQSQQTTMGGILARAFSHADLMKDGNSIILDERHTMHPKDWFNAFGFVILDSEISNPENLYQNLLNYANMTNNDHAQWLEKWWEDNNGIYSNILDLIPELIRNFECPITKMQLDEQRNNLKKRIEELTEALVGHLE